jgi:2-polyprenyl-3-methyl-5-hydroxy-6-metoxy-1,4-benzoquinol methylase
VLGTLRAFDILESRASMTTQVQERALESQGISNAAVYEMVVRVLAEQNLAGGTLVDVGCGKGGLWPYVKPHCDRYLGVDVIQHAGFPSGVEFIHHNLDEGKLPLADNAADLVISVETIEHVENPRAFMRELVRVAKPGGSIMVTTPNQLSILSKLTLLLKNQFNAFQEAPGLYPAHITALLEIDMVRIAKECGLEEIAIHYSNQGRMPFLAQNWQQIFRLKGRAFSDNLTCCAKKSS